MLGLKKEYLHIYFLIGFYLNIDNLLTNYLIMLNCNGMLNHFDFSVLSNNEFKEDAVREEIIYPILHTLGYSVSGKQKIVRSKALIHPFVYIGSQPRKINIIPDYILYYDSKPILVIDAKSPKEKIINSYSVEQVFSYAIHPDIRCDNYALCNGKEFVFFHVSEISPAGIIDIEKNKNNIEIFKKFLSPDYLLIPEKKHFRKDFGLFCQKSGITNESEITLLNYYLEDLTLISENNYMASSTAVVSDTSNSNMEVVDEYYYLTLDFDKNIFDDLMTLLPENISKTIRTRLSKRPFEFDLDCKIILSCKASLGKLTVSALTNEEFVPLVIKEIISAKFDPTSSCV